MHHSTDAGLSVGPTIEVADVFRQCEAEEIHPSEAELPLDQRRVLRAIIACRTAELGGHVEECDNDRCGHSRIVYNSCRSLYCPRCHGGRRARWVAEEKRSLLPVPYQHVVFTIPGRIVGVMMGNQKAVGNAFFRAVDKTLTGVARDALGVRVGFVAVLQTWGHALDFHPHIHCLVAAGGLSMDGERWVALPGGFFNSAPLSRTFREHFIAQLIKARQKRRIRFLGDAIPLANDALFERWILNDPGVWRVFSIPPFGGVETAIKYLSARAPITNDRIVSLANGHVEFTYKDYRDGCHQRLISLDPAEFRRRFLLHVMPKGFVRVRHFGIIGNRVRASNLRRCRELLPAAPREEQAASDYRRRCFECRQGMMRVVELLGRGGGGPLVLVSPVEIGGKRARSKC